MSLVKRLWWWTGPMSDGPWPTRKGSISTVEPQSSPLNGLLHVCKCKYKGCKLPHFLLHQHVLKYTFKEFIFCFQLPVGQSFAASPGLLVTIGVLCHADRAGHLLNSLCLNFMIMNTHNQGNLVFFGELQGEGRVRWHKFNQIVDCVSADHRATSVRIMNVDDYENLWTSARSRCLQMTSWRQHTIAHQNHTCRAG